MAEMQLAKMLLQILKSRIKAARIWSHFPKGQQASHPSTSTQVAGTFPVRILSEFRSIPLICSAVGH